MLNWIMGWFGPFNRLSRMKNKRRNRKEYLRGARAERRLHEAIRVVAAWPGHSPQQHNRVGPSDHRQASIVAYNNLRDYIKAFGIHDV